MQVFKCVLVDDELPGLAYLKSLCSGIPFVEVVKAFNDPSKFLKEATEIDFDLCILDIEMPGISGLELAGKLQGKVIIFATAYKEYAAEAFELEAVDYVTKPIRKERLEKALLRARQFLGGGQEGRQFVILNSNVGKVPLRFADIAIIRTSEVDRRDKTVLMKNNEMIILKNISFQQLLDLLPVSRFCQVNRKVAVALDCVRSFTHDMVTTDLRDDQGQPINIALSEQFRQAFRDKFNRQFSTENSVLRT